MKCANECDHIGQYKAPGFGIEGRVCAACACSYVARGAILIGPKSAYVENAGPGLVVDLLPTWDEVDEGLDELERYANEGDA